MLVFSIFFWEGAGVVIFSLVVFSVLFLGGGEAANLSITGIFYVFIVTGGGRVVVPTFLLQVFSMISLLAGGGLLTFPLLVFSMFSLLEGM